MDVTIQAATPQAPAAAPANLAGGDYAAAITSSPIFQHLVSGELPAAYAAPSVFGDHAQAVLPVLKNIVAEHKLGFADAPKSGVFVVYNPKKVTAEQVAKADADGKLNDIAAPLERQSTDGAPADGAAPAADASAAAPAAPPQNVAGGLLPAGAEDDLMRARVGSLTPKPPTKQGLPSQGIVNDLVGRAK